MSEPNFPREARTCPHPTCEVNDIVKYFSINFDEKTRTCIRTGRLAKCITKTYTATFKELIQLPEGFFRHRQDFRGYSSFKRINIQHILLGTVFAEHNLRQHHKPFSFSLLISKKIYSLKATYTVKTRPDR